MAIEYATKYESKVDERFALGTLSAGVVNQDFDWEGVETVKVFSVPTVAMSDYKTTGTNRYGTPSDLQNSAQTMTVSKDRSFTFVIDRKSRDDTQMTMEAGKALKRQIDEVVIPEVDTYRFAQLVANAAKNTNERTVIKAVTKSNAYEEFLACQAMLDDAKAPVGGRVCVVTPTYHNLIKLDESFTKKGDMATQIAINGLVGEIDGVPAIKVPSSYLPANVDFIITNPACMPAPMKLESYKIHEDPPGISGWLVEGRVRYDAFVLKGKEKAVVVHKSA